MSTTATDLGTLGNRAIPQIYVAVTFMVLTWTAVMLRVCVRGYIIRSFGWDDWTMLLTLALYTGLCACPIMIGRIETGEELKRAAQVGIIAEIPIIARLMKIIVVFMGLYLFACVVLKISLAIFFLRVITKQWHRNVVYVTTAVYTLYGITFGFMGVFQCGNPNHFLENQFAGNCLPNSTLQPMNYVSASLNALTDWVYVFFPIYVVWKASMPRAAKTSAGVLLALAAIGSISSLIRIAYIPGLKSGPHFFSEALDIDVWSVIEPGIGITAASLATLRPLFRFMRETTRNIKSFSSSTNRRSSNRGSGSVLGRKSSSASGMRGFVRQQEHDPERAIRFELVEIGSGQQLQKSRELRYNLDKETMLDDQSSTLPVLRLGQACSPPSLNRYSSSGDDSFARTMPPDQAYIQDGKVIIERPCIMAYSGSD